MPKVSDEHRAARRTQILDAAKRCFLRNGFHETSMQDLFTESGLSAGAVYRYFAGKDELIVAIAEENISDVAQLLQGFATANPHGGVGAALADLLEVVRTRQAADEVGALAVLVWSELLRNPELARRFDASLAPIRAALADVARADQAGGTLSADVSPEAVAATLMSLIPGYLLQLAIFGSPVLAEVPDVVRALWPPAS